MGWDPPRAGAVHHYHDRGSAEDYPHDARREVSGQAPPKKVINKQYAVYSEGNKNISGESTEIKI